MRTSPLPLLTLTLALAACADDADTGAQLLVPDTIVVEWDEHFDGRDDRRGSLLPVDLMVYDGTSGAPRTQVDLQVTSNHGGAELLDLDAIEVLAYDCAECVWDANRDRYLVLPDAPPEEIHALTTDETGLARLYIWVDSLPDDESGIEIQVMADRQNTPDPVRASFDIVGG